MQITKLIELRLRRLERRLNSLLFRSNRERLGTLLIDLVEQYGKPADDGILIDIKLSHQDLAGLIGATRESVTHLLGAMQLEGIIRFGRQRIVVRDPDRLTDINSQASGSNSAAYAMGTRSRPRKLTSQRKTDSDVMTNSSSVKQNTDAPR